MATLRAKQPAEFWLIGVDMTDALATGETLASSNDNGSLTATAYDSDGTDVSATVINGSPSISGNNVLVSVKAGTTGSVYNIQFLVPTSTGQILEEDILLPVAEKTST